MSKSLGNVISPQKVCDTLGADILRLWVASTDYSGDVSLSDTVLKRVVESYRRVRNTLKFLLANTVDFDPASMQLPVDRWLDVRWDPPGLMQLVVGVTPAAGATTAASTSTWSGSSTPPGSTRAIAAGCITTLVTALLKTSRSRLARKAISLP